MKKAELVALGKELGAEVKWDGGSRWVAVFHGKQSLVDPDRDCTFKGSRKYLGKILKSIQRSRERRATRKQQKMK